VFAACSTVHINIFGLHAIVRHGTDAQRAAWLPSLLARTTPLEHCARPSDGLSLFYADLDRSAVEIREIPKMGRHAVNSNQVFFDSMIVPADRLIGEEGKGFRYILDSLNAERILNAAEVIGMGRRALEKAVARAAPRPMPPNILPPMPAFAPPTGRSAPTAAWATPPSTTSSVISAKWWRRSSHRSISCRSRSPNR
jgi:alkylation response protein AidB-like acyl-CoA dehydrogenase